VSMTKREQAARAIGFLEGTSAILWSVGEQSQKQGTLQFCSEAAGFYDEQVECLRKAIFEDDEVEL